MRIYRYSKWDGTQNPTGNLESNFNFLADEILNAGDVNDALRNIFRDGFQSDQLQEGEGTGRPIGGLNDFRKMLNEEKRLNLERYNLESLVNGLSKKIEDIGQTEREEITNRLSEAKDQIDSSPDSTQGDFQDPMMLLQERADSNLARLDALPKSLSGSVRGLRDYDFMNQHASEKFQKLLADLRGQMAQNFFQHLRESLEGTSPEHEQKVREMVERINQMLRDREAGADLDFDGFMESFGHNFDPDRPTSLDELIDKLRLRVAAMHTMMQSMPEGKQQELNDIFCSGGGTEMMSVLEELAKNIHNDSPFDDLIEAYSFTGSDELTVDQAMDVLGEMQRIEELDRRIRDAIRSGNLGDVDLNEVEDILGKDSRSELEEVQRTVQALEEAGYLRRNRDRYELGPLAIRQIGQNAMREIFSQMKKARLGSHDSHVSGDWGDLSGSTLPYEFDRSFDINLQKSLFNTVARQGALLPLKMSYQDMEVNEREHLTQSATVLMLDQSRSMGMYGSYTSAKKVALALYWLITTKFPRDRFFVVGFSDYGMVISGKDLPESTWNHWVAGTNMHHGLMLARQLLSKENVANKQVLMVTDGEPTAHMEDGQAFFGYPPSHRTLEQTLREVKRCTREGIVINTFMLEANYFLMDFIDQMAKINKGRAFYTSTNELGRYVLVDYLRSRKIRV